MECGQSLGPLAEATPRATLSSRLGGGTEPTKGVMRWAGRASRVLVRRRTCSGCHSTPGSSQSRFELFQESVLLRLFVPGRRICEVTGERVTGVRGPAEDADEVERRDERGIGIEERDRTGERGI